MRIIIFVLLAIFLAVAMTYLGYPAGYYAIDSSTAAGFMEGSAVTLFGQVIYTNIQASYNGPNPPPPMPVVDVKGAIVIAFALNLTIASVLSTICWLIIKTVKRRHHPSH
jgi:hypothetical protein